jgi:hypothetical protein
MSIIAFGPHVKLNKSVVAPKTECGICSSEIVENETGKRNRNGESFVNTYSCNSCGQLFHSACANQWWLQYGQPSGNLNGYQINNRSAHDCPLCKMPWPPTDFNAATPTLAVEHPVAAPAPPAPPVNLNQLLISASSDRDMAAVVQLIAAGADVNYANQYGYTALNVASHYGYEGVVARLIAAGVNVNAADEDGRTALIWASEFHHEAVVAQLIRAGADMNAADNMGKTALIYASAVDSEAVVAQLIAAGADISAGNQYGYNALMYASEYGHEAVVAQLIDAGANVNAVNNYGTTAVRFASSEGHEAVVALLVAAGAQRN